MSGGDARYNVVFVVLWLWLWLLLLLLFSLLLRLLLMLLGVWCRYQIGRGGSLFLLWLFFPVVVVPFVVVVVVVVGRLMPISDRAGRLAQLWLLLVLQPTTIDLSPHMSETQSSIFFHIPRANHCNALEPLKSFEPFQPLEPLEPLKPFEPLQPPNWLVTTHVRNSIKVSLRYTEYEMQRTLQR